MISVIIPALDEEDRMPRCLSSLNSEDDSLEIIVSDGGSTDRTPEAARASGAHVVRSARGRGIQMNAGAAAASGGIFLFLHADTVIGKGWSSEVREVLEDRRVAAGAFSLGIDASGPGYRMLEQWVRFRSVVFGLPYGDQALFMRRETFWLLGGFRPIPLMEDVDMVARLRKAGRLAILRRRVSTNARRWRQKGMLRTSFENHMIMFLYRCGVDPGRLAGIYYGKK